MERQNIYRDVEMRETVVSTPLIAVIVCALTTILLLALLARVVYNLYYKDKFQVHLLYSRATQPFQADDGNNGDDRNWWKRTFNKIISNDPQRTLNSAVLHAILFLPVDLELPNPLENAELFNDKFCLSRAKERRRMLDDLFSSPNDKNSVETSEGEDKVSQPVSKYSDPNNNTPQYFHRNMKSRYKASINSNKTGLLTQTEEESRMSSVNDVSENQQHQREPKRKQRTPRE
ncbi:uncharacterized protein TM35_000161790 [Trypanosoma theileri]|uniref:Uncharacterized protein n=1 Tax=Trypanosoma theileri TaxID=67003 RepID=A0A1X0NVA6_9TRYP|nr:uncharacterized protein TM35_000161790 [Trypanosoma theileri]ORC88541.1 hypothetical protein TM35_000161790 [Trypanosoma theileri]